MQNLLVSGRKKEALESAQEGQLWGPALVLASQLGDQVLTIRSYLFVLVFSLRLMNVGLFDPQRNMHVFNTWPPDF